MFRFTEGLVDGVNSVSIELLSQGDLSVGRVDGGKHWLGSQVCEIV